ncbi:MAG: sigma-70 family RNA polymerase sigma factor [Phycisphaerales bacterium]
MSHLTQPSMPRDGVGEPAPAETRLAVTQLLARARNGDPRVTDELFPIVYDELRAIAARFLKGESRAQTLQATALVHEAYLRLVGPEQTPWESRAHFFGAAAKAIRRILTDNARHRGRLKRGGGAARAPLDEALVVAPDSRVDLEGLDEALTKLAALDPQKARVVELRFFAGLTVEQTALALGVSPSTVARDWQFARVWLSHKLGGAEGRRP